MLLTLVMAVQEHTGFQTLTQRLDIIDFWQKKMLHVLDRLCENGGIDVSSIPGYDAPLPTSIPHRPATFLCLPLVGECLSLPWWTLRHPFPRVLPAGRLDHVSTDVLQSLDSF